MGNGLYFNAVGQVEQVARPKFINLSVNGITGMTLNNIRYIIAIRGMLRMEPPIRAAFSKDTVKDFRHKIVINRTFHNLLQKLYSRAYR
jgi:hypothetical protein